LPTTIELVRDLYLVQKRSDAEIAAELNRRGLTTGVSRAWDVPSVRRVRYAAGLYRPSPKSRRSPDRNADGLWSMHAVAARVGVRPGVIRYWVREGVLEPVAHGGPGRPHWFTLDDTTLARLHAAAKQFAGRGGAVVTVDPRPEVAETPAMDATAPGDPRRPQKTVRRRATPSRGARQDHP
jgi:MerR HTH family regulatory protein